MLLNINSATLSSLSLSCTQLFDSLLENTVTHVKPEDRCYQCCPTL